MVGFCVADENKKVHWGVKEIGPLADVNVNPVQTESFKPVQRFERKFFVLPEHIDFAYALLRQSCHPDRQYPEEQINTLYFDTPDLEQYMRSASGEFKKDKVRIRWYAKVENQQEMVPVFMELKSRQGFASNKQRRELQVSARQLELARLGAGIVDKAMLINTVAEFGYFPALPLQPVIVISYWRYRFSEMLTGIRVSLDCHIRSSMVAAERGYGERELWLRGAVIEVKGPTMELPVTLKRMRFLDMDWGRFSKYGNCVESHLSGPGTVGRLWPSGRIS